MINFYSIPSCLVAVYTLVLGILVLKAGPRASKNRYFFLLSFFSFAWLFSYGVGYSLQDRSAAFPLMRIGHIFATYISPIIYFLVIDILKDRAQKLDIICSKTILFSCILTTFAACFSPLYIVDLKRYFWGYYLLGGPLMAVYALLTFAVALRLIYVLRRAARETASQDASAEHYKYYFISLIIFVFGALDYVPKLGIPIYPFGYVFVALFATIASYAVVRHRLMDVSIIIRRSTIYSSLILLLTLLFSCLLLLVKSFFHEFPAYQSILFAFMVSCLTALGFNPLLSRIQSLIDRLFFKKDPETLAAEHQKLMIEIGKSDQMKAVGTFAAGMAHEIKNPLTAIKIFTENLSQKSHDPQFMETYHRIMTAEVYKIERIVKELLEFSKPSHEINFSKVDARRLLEETLELMNEKFLKHSIRVQKEFSSTPISLMADAKLLKQAFLNLLLNAVEAMPSGGQLTVRLEREKNTALIFFKDTGTGIPEEKIQHIFDPFFTTKDSGTGLGLSIVREIIEKHQGRITVHSRVGQGTEFCLKLWDLDPSHLKMTPPSA